MLIAILSGAVCLIISIILFTPMFRHFTILRPVALFFIFEGIWIFVDYDRPLSEHHPERETGQKADTI